jgi:hypothetical protein
MSKKNDNLKIVTANRLRQGDVVYLTDTGKWSIHLNQSRTTRDAAELEAMLAQAGEAVEAREIVAPYEMEVVEVDGILQPLSTREIIRAAGPTVRADYRGNEQQRSRAA